MKRIRVCFTRLMAAVLLSAIFVPQGLCSEKLTEEEKTFLKTRGEIVFVSQTVYPPFEFVEKQGDHTGMCIELARWMATEFGFKARFTDTVFKEAQQAILSGEADVLTSLFYSKKRNKQFDFTDTIFDVPAFIFVAADRPDIKSIEDLNGKTIAVQKGDYALDFLQSRGISFEVVYTTNFAEATDRVIAGKADAVIGDEQIVLYHVYSLGLSDHIKKVGEPLYIGQDCMAVKEGNGVLQSILNKGVSMARTNGVLDRIQRKWLGTRIPLRESLLDRYKFQIMGLLTGMAAVILLVWFWNLQLKRKVVSRTEELGKSEETLRTILAASPVGIGVLRRKEIDWHNEAMTRITGYAPEELKGKPPQFLYADEETGKKTDFEVLEMLRRQGSASLETRWRRKDGSVFDCMIRYAPMGGKQKEALFVVLAEDITERLAAEAARKASEERAQDALREKEILLREIHHRVKNNMQVISSLLSLQTAKGISKEVAEAFLDAQNRVQSMALVHEILYQSENLGEIELQSYLGRLVNHLFQAFASQIGRIGIHIDAGKVKMGIDQAMPLGLIVNELITNSLKYAFPSGTGGDILT